MRWPALSAGRPACTFPARCSPNGQGEEFTKYGVPCCTTFGDGVLRPDFTRVPQGAPAFPWSPAACGRSQQVEFSRQGVFIFFDECPRAQGATVTNTGPRPFEPSTRWAVVPDAGFLSGTTMDGGAQATNFMRLVGFRDFSQPVLEGAW